MADNQAKVMSIAEMARYVNNSCLGEDVLVSTHRFSDSESDFFPVRIDAMLIIIVESGTGKLGIDLREFDIEENMLVVIQPRNFITFARTRDCTAKIVACSREAIERIVPKLTDLLPLMMHHAIEPVTPLTQENRDSMLAFFNFLKTTLDRPSSRFRKPKVMCMLQAALYEMIDIQTSNSPDLLLSRSRKEEIMARFILEVSKSFREVRTVGHYADALCISPKHLSAVVKSISGRTAGEWIESYVIMEAKVLLKTTDLTVQEISAKLHFANQSFFGKYFRHLTGLSPSEFRKLEK